MKRLIASGVAALVTATVLWSFTGVFVKHFCFLNLDGDTQNLFRYLAATVGLWAWILPAYRQEARAALRRWRAFVLPTVVNCAFQVVMVFGLYHKSIYPGFQSLLGQSSVLFATVMAYLIFHEEREVIRSPRYLWGSLLAICGVVGVIAFGQPIAADFNSGVLAVLLSSFLWACYTLSMKHAVRDTHPIIAFAVVSTFTTIFFAVLALARSEPGHFFDVGALGQFLVILSGLACISVAHSLYFVAVKRIGVAVCASFLLVQPLLTNVLSAAVLGEKLTAPQMAMGLVLLGGAYLVILARNAPR